MIQIFDKYPWHPSDQPTILKREDKKLLRKESASDFIKLLLTNLFFYPYLLIKFLFKNKKTTHTKVDTSFYGLCVNLDKGEEQVALVQELGVKSLQIRFYLSDMENLDSYVAFAKSFGDDKDILINIIQDRKHIEQAKLLHKDIRIVFDRFSKVTNRFIIGNAINRIKWGFVSMEEYLEFYAKIQNVRNEYFPHIRLIGSSVIDFEYHFTIRSLFNNSNIHYDGLASLLYVDRRGAPSNTQYGIFDLKNKIEFLDTIVKSANRCEKEIIISETNWPLKNTAPYAPTSEEECVSEEEYTKYMLEYFDISRQTGKIKTIYWHQLIAPGYGLVDNRDGVLRKMPQFEAFKKDDTRVKYLGIDFAWSKNNFSALALLEDDRFIECVYLKSDEDILEYIHQTKPDIIGVDAALEVKNESGNRIIENQILKDFAKYKLGVYPINKNIMDKLYGGNRAEELFVRLEDYPLREKLFEVYTHATIIRCFTKDRVLPYKRKKGRTTPFIKEQLEILQNYLDKVVYDMPKYPISESKSKDLKEIEDRLDAVVCAYSLFRSFTKAYDSYDDLLLIPKEI